MSVSNTIPCSSPYKLENIRGLANKVVCNLEKAFNESDLRVYDLGLGALASFATFATLDLCFKNAQILSRLVHEIGKDNQNEKGPLTVLFMIALLGAASGGITGYVSRKIERYLVSMNDA